MMQKPFDEGCDREFCTEPAGGDHAPTCKRDEMTVEIEDPITTANLDALASLRDDPLPEDAKAARQDARATYMVAKWARERAEAKLQKMTEAKAKRDDIRAQTRVLRERQEAERKARLAYDTARQAVKGTKVTPE